MPRGLEYRIDTYRGVPITPRQSKPSNTPRHNAARGVFATRDSEGALHTRQIIAEQMRRKLGGGTPTTESAAEREISEVEREGEFAFGNPELPSWHKKQEIIDTVSQNRVTVISGETGCGKSTQVPQFLLEAEFEKIVITQPRLMAANGVAERIRDELQGAFQGEERARDLVGIQTSEKNDVSNNARILVRTDGLEQIMQLEERLGRMTRADAKAEAARTVLILDEAHESNPNMVGLQALMKRLLVEHPDMRLVVMSATVDTERYARYYSDIATDGFVPVIEIEGRPHKVEVRERPEVTVKQALRELLQTEGAIKDGEDILVFTHGQGAIKDLIAECRTALCREDVEVHFLPLYAAQTEQEQARVLPDHSGINIIVATDVAMTSLTFPRVRYVIDQGLTKNPHLDEENAGGLVLEACSRAECMQRAGRTGRVQDGEYWLVNPENDMSFVTLVNRPRFPSPPIFSTELSRMALLYAAYDVDIREFDFIDDVSWSSRLAAFDKLRVLGAVDKADAITAIGRCMNNFPVKTEHARMLAEALRPHVPENVFFNVALVAAAFEAGGLRDFFSKNTGWKDRIRDPRHDIDLEMRLFRAIGTKTCGEGQDRQLLRGYGLSAKSVIKARKSFHKMCRAAGKNPYDVVALSPTPSEARQIEHCIASGLVDTLYARGDKLSKSKQYSYTPLAREGLRRTISNRSVVPKSPELVAGTPRFYMSGDKKNDIIENVLPVTRESIKKLDIPTELVRVGLVAQGGMLKVVNEKRIGAVAIEQITTPAVMSEADVRTALIEAVMNHPGAAQRHLLEIKDKLLGLYHLSGNPNLQRGASWYESLVLEAVRDAETAAPYAVDNELWRIINERNISLDGYCSPTVQEAIRQRAVRTVDIGGRSLGVIYQNGKPIVRKVPPELVDDIPDSVTIPDGREVWFRVPVGYDEQRKASTKRTRGFRDVTGARARSLLQQAWSLV